MYCMYVHAHTNIFTHSTTSNLRLLVWMPCHPNYGPHAVHVIVIRIIMRHTSTCTRTCTHAHVQWHTCTHSRTHKRTHRHMHMHTHTHTHTDTHTCTHARTDTCHIHTQRERDTHLAWVSSSVRRAPALPVWRRCPWGPLRRSMRRPALSDRWCMRFHPQSAIFRPDLQHHLPRWPPLSPEGREVRTEAVTT